MGDERMISMIITKKSLPRRTFLRGLGATLALPLLDGMVPALRPLRASRGRRRCVGWASSTCRTGSRWSSGRRRADGAGFELTPILRAARAVPRPHARRERA